MDFGRLLDPFWELKWHEKIGEILDAILEANKEVPPHFWDQPGGMRGAVGRLMEGYKDAKIAGVTRTRHLELSSRI